MSENPLEVIRLASLGPRGNSFPTDIVAEALASQHPFMTGIAPIDNAFFTDEACTRTLPPELTVVASISTQGNSFQLGLHNKFFIGGNLGNNGIDVVSCSIDPFLKLYSNRFKRAAEARKRADVIYNRITKLYEEGQIIGDHRSISASMVKPFIFGAIVHANDTIGFYEIPGELTDHPVVKILTIGATFVLGCIKAFYSTEQRQNKSSKMFARLEFKKHLENNGLIYQAPPELFTDGVEKRNGTTAVLLHTRLQGAGGIYTRNVFRGDALPPEQRGPSDPDLRVGSLFWVVAENNGTLVRPSRSKIPA